MWYYFLNKIEKQLLFGFFSYVNSIVYWWSRGVGSKIACLGCAHCKFKLNPTTETFSSKENERPSIH